MITDFKFFNDCDGCKYFDINNLTYYYPGYENPLYYLIYKKTIEELVFISPKEYIQQVAKGHHNSYDRELDLVNQTLVDKYITDFKKGDKFPVGFYTEKGSSQEGRHRAIAMLQMGIKKIPIIKIQNISKKYIKDIVNEIKNLTYDEVNQYFINKGYNGITDLDWHELQSYIKYPDRY